MSDIDPPFRSGWLGRVGVSIVVCLFGTLAWTPGGTVHAQPPLLSPLAGESLVGTPLTLSIDNQNTDELLGQVLGAVDHGRRVRQPPGARQAPGETQPSGETQPLRSVWLDRHVGRGKVESLAAIATPAAQVVLQIAEDAQWAVFPLPGVLLAGRPDWVDGTLAHLAQGVRQPDRISVTWPTGSTANEVLFLIVKAPTATAIDASPTDLASVMREGESSRDREPSPTWLPHDVWPGGKLIGVDRTLAVSLVLAQFRLSIRPGTRLETLTPKPVPGTIQGPENASAGRPEGVQPWSEVAGGKPFPLSYPSGQSAVAIRESLGKLQPRSTIRASEGKLLVLATATHHRRAIAAHWRFASEHEAADQAGGKRPDPPANAPGTPAVFDLKLINKSAADVLGQLAAADRKKIRIESNAVLASEQLVSLDASKKTLRELAETVADAVGLKLTWNQDELVVDKR